MICASIRAGPTWRGRSTLGMTPTVGFSPSTLTRQLEGHDELLAHVVPGYPPFGKRMLLDNGWYAALTRPNVTLVPLGVSAVDAGGLVDSSGRHHDVDVIIWATGFQAGDSCPRYKYSDAPARA